MRSTARMLTGTALAVAAAGLGTVPAYGGGAAVAASHPRNTPVLVTAAHPHNTPASVAAAHPHHTAVLVTAAHPRSIPVAVAAATGTLEVYPSTAIPGGQITVNTKACGEKGTAAGDASAVGAGTFILAPSTHEGDAIGQFRVPPSAQPGTYEIVARCAEGDRRVTGDLMVTLTAAHSQMQPHGSVKTGVGGALGSDPVQTAAGVAALAVAAAGGTWLLHRRARGDDI